VWRVQVIFEGQPPLPEVFIDGDFVMGPGPDAKIRLPSEASPLRVVGDTWEIFRVPKPPIVACPAPPPEYNGGTIGESTTIYAGFYRVVISRAAAGAVATSPQRTESLARELVRGLMGTGGAPTVEVERGPEVGASRTLAPPESVLVIGRGDEADWVILDGDLSKRHAELRRGWDGVRVHDLDSKNGTRADGVPVPDGGAALRDGSLVELGKVRLRFRDPAQRTFDAITAATPAAAAPAPVPATGPRTRPGSVAVYYSALALVALSLACLVWVLSA
jgi:hypothetical protein